MGGVTDSAAVDPEVVALIIVAVSGLMLAGLMVLRGRRGSAPIVRPLEAFGDLRREIQGVAETGGTIHLAVGSGSLVGEDTAISLAGLQVLAGVVDAALSYGVPPLITVGDATLLIVCQDVLRRAYERRGLLSVYDPGRVRFIGPSDVGYAAGAGYELSVEGVSVSVMAGAFGAEVSLVSDAAGRRGIPQLAGAADPLAVGALYSATENLAIGEELFAAGAQTTQDRPQLVSLLVQDVLRVNLVLVTVLAAILALIGTLAPR